jgi:hypothetical protein
VTTVTNWKIAAFITLLVIAGTGTLLFRDSAVGKDDNSPSQQETEFCSTVENAWRSYGDLSVQRDVARRNNNGIVVQQFENKMTSVYRQRNNDVFAQLSRADFAFDAWILSIVRIMAPSNGRVKVDANPVCSEITVVHTDVSATPEYLNVLSLFKQGSRFMASGRFVQAAMGRGTRPESPEYLESSITELGSMHEPEYTASVTSLK